MYPRFIRIDIVVSSLVILWHFVSLLTAQQQYAGISALTCNNTDKTGPSPAFLYTCNGQHRSCQTFIIFRSQPTYNSAISISKLLNSPLLELSQINNISASEPLPPNSEVIVPVNCLCSGNYYQANSSYTIQSESDTYYKISTKTFQGLSSCNSIIQENPYGIYDLEVGDELRVPLRCACPTKNQTSEGIKFLLTYLVDWNDNIDDVSKRFNVTTKSIVDANGFLDVDSVLFPNTTVLIPLLSAPLSSQTRRGHPPLVVAPPSRRHKNSIKWILVGIGIGSSLALLSCLLFLIFWHSRGGKITTVFLGSKQRKDSKHLTDIKQKINDFEQDLKIFGFDELECATEGFSARNQLSDSVYHGVLRGKSVAIKKMNRDVKKEVRILQKINHFNLVSLYGVCKHNCLYYLAYEFMGNGSLRQWINQEENPESRSWNIRIRMALDVANGLDYLHNFTAPGYVHKDINSSNVLVSSDLRAKIANSSFAKPSKSRGNGNSTSFSDSCSKVMGTKGYMAPEYLETGRVSPKMDVYAFGVVLLELITGKEAVFKEDGREVWLSEAAIKVMSAANATAAIGRFIDPKLQEKHPLGFIIDNSRLALRLLEVSAACLATDPTNRPTMAAVISSLMKVQLDVKTDCSFSM